MTDEPRTGSKGALARAAQLRPIGVDEMSAVRHVHASSLKALAARHLSSEEIEAFTALVYSTEYVDALVKQRLVGAWIGTDLVGTAGWMVADDMGGARIRSLFVRPMFTGDGIGRLLLETMEEAARASGYRRFSVRSTHNAVGFFERMGYLVTSHGVRPLTAAVALPVAFMRKTDEPRGAVREGEGETYH